MVQVHVWHPNGLLPVWYVKNRYSHTHIKCFWEMRKIERNLLRSKIFLRFIWKIYVTIRLFLILAKNFNTMRSLKLFSVLDAPRYRNHNGRKYSITVDIFKNSHKITQVKREGKISTRTSHGPKEYRFLHFIDILVSESCINLKVPSN